MEVAAAIPMVITTRAKDCLVSHAATHDPTTLLTVACKRKDLLFIVGRGDRVPLYRKLRSQYEANVGLAQSRAVATMELLFFSLG